MRTQGGDLEVWSAIGSKTALVSKTGNVGLLSLLPALKNYANVFSDTEIFQAGFLSVSHH